MDAEVSHSAKQMMNSAAFGQIIILIVYFPILALVGIEGKMFRPMAETVSFAIIGALILSLTYVPMMSSLFLSKKISHKKNFSDKMMERIQRGYSPLIKGALRFKRTVVLLAFGLLAAAIVVFFSFWG
ncbi:efflux RND transporter permease subunit [Niabella defluvii]|nr:efflux RND transporter permease subunit [Niabella sp. I65]